MLYPEFAYRGAALGDLKFRNHVVRSEDLKGRLDASERRECYSTIARFPEAYLTHRNESGSVEGYDGDCYVDTLWFDIDDKDLETSLAETFHLLMTLEA